MGPGDQQPSLFPVADTRDYFAALCDELSLGSSEGWPDQFGLALHEWCQQAPAESVSCLSLFSGAGGLDIGFHDAGFSIRELVEIDKRFVRTLELNAVADGYLGECEIQCLDIRDYRPNSDAGFDFVIGGPPCQSFSAAGRRASGVRGIKDDRGTLFEEYVRILGEVKPKGFLFENVYGITGANKGKAWEAICEAFESAGYSVCHRILDTADFGVPQHRERMFIVGVHDGTFRFPRPTHGPDSPRARPFFTAAEAMRGATVTKEEAAAKVNGRYGGLLEQVPPGLNYSFFTERMGHPNPLFAWRSKFSDFIYKADPDAPVRTIKALGGQFTGPFHWGNRPFAVAELKRLQTFPDAYRLAGSRQLCVQQIGNSVPPQMARMLALAVLDQVFDVRLPAPLDYLSRSDKLGFRSRKRQLTGHYRRKAERALADGPSRRKRKRVRGRSYRRRLTRGFGWKLARNSDGVTEISFAPHGDSWELEARHASTPRAKRCFRIAVQPDPVAGWSIPLREVLLYGCSYDREVFTGIWKSFEEELIRAGLKADLVQLCGYYQYRPQMTVIFEPIAPLPDGDWRVVRCVCEGIGVGETLPARELADVWQIKECDVLQAALSLRMLGYEARNEMTNPEIPAGHFLVPYMFPTLTPMSVQLNKALLGE